MDKYRFGEFIYQKRKEIGLTQDELGRKLGVTNKAVSKWETGETLPEVSMLENLAKILNVSIDELLTQNDNPRNNIKKIRINRILLIAIIVLFCLNIITLLVFVNKMNKEKYIDINIDNYYLYINIDPLYSFDSNGEELIIKSLFSINKNYLVKEEIKINIEYSIYYYYYSSNGIVSVVTYFDRNSEVIFTEKETINELKVSPKRVNDDYKNIKTIEVQYNVLSVDGSLKEVNNEKKD